MLFPSHYRSEEAKGMCYGFFGKKNVLQNEPIHVMCLHKILISDVFFMYWQKRAVLGGLWCGWPVCGHMVFFMFFGSM